VSASWELVFSLDEHRQEPRGRLFVLLRSFIVTFVILTSRDHASTSRRRGAVQGQRVDGSWNALAHAVPGISCWSPRRFMYGATGPEHPWTDISAVINLLGTSLVLDEFAAPPAPLRRHWRRPVSGVRRGVSLALSCMAWPSSGSAQPVQRDSGDTPTCSAPPSPPLRTRDHPDLRGSRGIRVRPCSGRSYPFIGMSWRHPHRPA